MPDLATFIRICKWLGENPNKFVEGDASWLGEDNSVEVSSAPERVEAFFRADKTLPPETIGALSEMVRLAYRAAERGELVGED